MNACFRIHIVVIAPVILLAFSAFATAEDWPQWRGPNRDNVSTETGLLQEWPEGGPPLAWKAEGIGTGISCIAVAGGRIITVGYHNDSEYAVALDEQTGELAWATRIGPAVQEHRLMRWLAQRAPTIDGERVYVVTYDGNLVCLDAADGKERWRKQYVEEFGAQRHPWGIADYPLVDGERVICVPGGRDATVVALNKNTGELLQTWLLSETRRDGYSATVTAEVEGIRQYIAFLDSSLVGLAAEDDNVLWRYKRIANRTGNSHTPIVIGNHVLCTNGYGTGIALLQLVSENGEVDVEEKYFQRQGLEIFADPTIRVADLAFTTKAGKALVCFDWKTGAVRWQKRINVGGRISTTFADGRLYAYSSDGTVVLIEADKDVFQQRGRFVSPDFKPSIGVTNPVVAGGRLYVRDDSRLFCYDIRDRVGQRSGEQPATIVVRIRSAGSDRAESEPEKGRAPNPIYVPTPQDVVKKMLDLAAVTKRDTVVDLGSGDGRIVITAAKQHGAKAIGYEIDKELVALSREKLDRAEVGQRAKIKQQDMYTADLSESSVVAVFLYPVVLEKLKPQFAEMKPGSRIVSHQFEIPNVEADRVVEFASQVSANKHRIVLYTTPLKRSRTGGHHNGQTEQ